MAGTQIAGRCRMELDLKRCRLEGWTAYLNDEALISNPYNVSRNALPVELLQELAWTHGWLSAEGEAARQAARDARRQAALKDWPL